MGPKTGHISRRHGLIRAMQARALPNALVAVGLAFTLVAPAYAGRNVFGTGAAATGNRDAARAQAFADSQANALRIQAAARERLARSAEAFQGMQAAQAAARASATALNNVANGLVPGGLEVLPKADPDFRLDGAEDPVAAGNDVTIKQNNPQAVLHWKTFNVGRDTTVNFDQSKGGADARKWIAFNKVFDPLAAPSQIRGRINAQGQVYVINPNGIIFGESAQVNTRTFVASTLPINENLVRDGLLNNTDAQFIFDGIRVPAGDRPYGDIEVKEGARLQATAGQDGNGGRVMLVGANVVNEGTINTPAGQTILAAGLQVGVRAHPENDPSLRGLDVWIGQVGDYAGCVENNGLVQSSTGSIIMAGKEVRQRGVLASTTSVNLNGRIDLLASYGAVSYPQFDNIDEAKTDVPFLSQFTGLVELAPGSLTSILPDANGKKLPGTRLSQNSKVNIDGKAVYFGRGSILAAPSGDVTVRAGQWSFVDGQQDLGQHFVARDQKFLFDRGQVYLDEGSIIDVSGSVDGFVPLDQHLLTVAMRSSELADSPVQRNSALRGVPLVVDLREAGVDSGRSWIGTPLGDLTGYLAIIERDIAQLTARGGTVSLSAGDSIVMRRGATVDVSGGLLTHGAGYVQTSMLSLGGRATPISSARTDINYDGVYTGTATVTSKWRAPQTYSSGIFNPANGYDQNSYFEGAPAGTASLNAPSLALAGNLIGKSYASPDQRTAPPALGSLRLAFLGEKNAGSFTAPAFVQHSPFAPEFRLTAGRASSPVLPEFELVNGEPVALPAALRGTFTLGEAIFDEDEGGFGNLDVENADGDFFVGAETSIRLRPGGELAVSAKNVRVDGTITIAGGDVTLTAYNFSPYLYRELLDTGRLVIGSTAVDPPPPVQPGRGSVALGNSARIDVSGMMVDDRSFADNQTYGPVLIDGGSVHLEGYAVQLPSGSVIDASGGVYAFGGDKFSFGDGGSISILSGRDKNLETSVGGPLQLEGTLQAFSGTKGGSLTLQSNFIHLGGVSRPSTGINLSPRFFQSGGFSSYNLIGLGGRDADNDNLAGVVVAGGIQTSAQTLVQQSRASVNDPVFRRMGTDVFVPLVSEFAGDRQAVSLNLSATGFDDGSTKNVIEALGLVEILAGSRITTEAGASVSLKGDVVKINGSIIAPGGSIKIDGKSSYPLSSVESLTVSSARPTVEIGSTARLSAAGTAAGLPDLNGLRAGKLFPGGSIALSGNIVADEGAVFDVRGSSAVFDFSPQRLGLPPSDPKSLFKVLLGLPARVDSDGGRITLAGSQMLYSDATLLGGAGGASALGGTLAVSSGRFYFPNEQTPVGADRPGFADDGRFYDPDIKLARSGADLNMVVSQSGSASTFWADRKSKGFPDLGFFAVDQFTDGGFDSLDLGYFYNSGASPSYGGNIDFQGPVSIQASRAVRVAQGGIIKNDYPVTISAPYVSLGQMYQGPLNPSDANRSFVGVSTAGVLQTLSVPPTSGDGLLDVQASLIDVGHLSLQGSSRAELTAQWDIRGYGSLNVVGDLVLTAGQIYPTTLSAFDIFAFDNPEGALGSVTIQGRGNRPLPLSAGGSLRIMASSIVHGGTLRAPLGTITLGWDEVDLDEASVEADGPSNLVVGRSMPTPATRLISLENGSVTSVSAVDPSSGAGILIPYGLSPNGFTWIDPRGVDVTAGGLPSRGVSIGADDVTLSSDATVDLQGGGDLLAFRWVAGIGGSADILGTANSAWRDTATYKAGNLVQYKGGTWSARTDVNPADYAVAPEPSKSMQWAQIPESFAVLPGFESGFAPLNDFNPLAGDPGYSTGGLRVGEQVFLAGLPGLAAGSYTLLPRRYALLPGAFLVQPEGNKFISSGSVVTTSLLNSRSLPFEASTLLPDGIIRAQGFGFNGLSNPSRGSLREYMAVLTPAQVAARAQYDKYTANVFFEDAAKRLDLAEAQLLPKDSARAAFHGNTGLVLEGSVLARSIASNGKRGSIDISSFGSIRLVGHDGTADESTSLRTDTLGGWGAGSLLVGGLRRETTDGAAVDVRSPSVILDNPGNEFVAPEIILAAANRVVMEAGSTLSADDKGAAFTADPLLLTGEGALLRVSADKNAISTRSAVSGGEGSILSVGAGSILSGASITMDSSSALSLDFTTSIAARSLALSSGQISVLMGPYDGDLDGSVVENHLVLDDEILSQLGSLETLRLVSYQTIDLYGSGALGSSELGRLELLSGGLRGFGSMDNNTSISANTLVLANPNSVSGLPVYGEDMGSLTIEAGSVILSAGAFSASGYGQFVLNSAGGLLTDHDGSLHVAGSLAIAAPQIVTGQGVRYNITTERSLDLLASEGEESVSAGLGGRLSLTGSSVNVDTAIDLPAGVLSITATEGDVMVAGHLSVAGQAREFFDVTRYANAGSIELVSRSGAVVLQEGSFVSVSADEGGGDAGTLNIKSPGGAFSLGGAIAGMAKEGNVSGTLVLDAGSIGDFDELSAVVDTGGFREERAFRVRDGNVLIGGETKVRNFALSADRGDITMRGSIDASGETGGSIRLVTSGSLTLEPTAVLDVSGRNFSNAGKGGSIVLEAGATIDGLANESAMLTLGAGSLIDLSVAAFRPDPYNSPNSSAFLGQFEGMLHLRAPRLGNDLRVGSIGSQIHGGSSVLVEGFRVYQPEGGIMNIALRDSIHADNAQFINDSEAALRSRLLAGPNTTLDQILVLAPGVEILNLDGDLILGQANVSGSENIEALSDADWDLSGWRYGSQQAPGVLTLRGAGDLVFNNALSDGFTPVSKGTEAEFADRGNSRLWLAPLQSVNGNLPVNIQSWSYRLASGADLGTSDFRSRLSLDVLDQLDPSKGSILVGEFFASPVPNNISDADNSAAAIGSFGQTADTIRINRDPADQGTRYEVIRTGTGTIDVIAGRDVQFRNPFASIYTAGVGLSQDEINTVFKRGDFSIPVTGFAPSRQGQELGESLGVPQQTYGVHYGLAGGDVRVSAGADLARYQLSEGNRIADASGQTPATWLMKRGLTDADGYFAAVTTTDNRREVDRSASTTWWIDYSSFFQSFGALGGGNISLESAGSMQNIDAAIPTTARMAGIDPDTGLNLRPSAEGLRETGGGDLTMRAGRNVDGGSIYLERGAARIFAGEEITTNVGQSANAAILEGSGQFLDPLTWQPLTFYLGRASVDVRAMGDVLAGPTANPFLLPSGINNQPWYRTAFSTYGESSSLSVSSVGGSITHRWGITKLGDLSTVPVLSATVANSGLINESFTGWYRPWLRLLSYAGDSENVPLEVGAPVFRSTSFSGDIHLAGTLHTAPSPVGDISLLASGSLFGLTPTGRTQNKANVPVTAWTSARLNLSDAPLISMPGVLRPVAPDSSFFSAFRAAFDERGGYKANDGIAAVKSALHSPDLLRVAAPDPLRLYAQSGDVLSLELFSGKRVRVLAGRDATDLSLYFQHLSASDISLVSAGRDIIPFNENNARRTLAADILAGNVVVDASGTDSGSKGMAGDLQVGGRGIVQVLAGRDLDLGTGPNRADGTGVGLTSIGRLRNPFLPFEGAHYVVMAGVGGVSSGPALGLTGSSLNFGSLPSSGFLGDSTEHMAVAAVRNLFTRLQQVGKDAALTGNYDAGYAAVEEMFGKNPAAGNIFTRSRDLRTTSGGSIIAAAPGGSVTMASDIFGNPLTPPGIVTEYGGEVSILTGGNVDIGRARIFTLRGGDLTIWSSRGDIAAGTAAKTVVTAPPTRVLIDPTSAEIETDLGGLATGGGIGVLASVAGIEPGAVTLLAPRGTVDAGDAGIRATGNITIAAAQVLNADNISASGASVGVPVAPAAAAPNVGGLSSASSSTAATSQAASDVTRQAQSGAATDQQQAPSTITVEVLGYGGGEESEDEREARVTGDAGDAVL
jgi:filamentous hemagglutinin family protein